MEPEPQRPSLVVALFVAITWAAVTFAVAGVLAVILDKDPVEGTAPIWSGPLALAVAGGAVWLGVVMTARSRRPWVGALASAATVYLVFTAAALLSSFAMFLEQAGSPFVIAAAVLAGVAVALAWFVMRRPPNAGLSDPRLRS